MELHSSSRFVGGRRRQFGLDVHLVDGLLHGVDLLEVCSLWRLLGGGVALDATSKSLRVALDDHGLEWWNLLLSLGFVHVCRWRSDAVDLVVADVGVASGPWVGVSHVLEEWLADCQLLVIGEVVVHLVLEVDFLERVSVDALSLVVTEDHALSLAWLSASLDVLGCVLLVPELLDAVAVHDLELLVAELVVRLVTRDN